MYINIIKGSVDYLNDCEDALQNSELGRQYFSQNGSARKALEEGFTKEEIYIALDKDNRCKGFLWILFKGVFHSFPYLHIIAIKEEFRGQGIGKVLMKFFEDTCFVNSTKVFLVVADFNPEAKRFYENIGYTEIGSIPDLYRPGITEYLMMKVRPLQ